MSNRPNLLVITTDQQRWDWLGCHGTPGVATPNLDALAARSTNFTNAYVNNPVCMPNRSTIGANAGAISSEARSNRSSANSSSSR